MSRSAMSHSQVFTRKILLDPSNTNVRVFGADKKLAQSPKLSRCGSRGFAARRGFLQERGELEMDKRGSTEETILRVLRDGIGGYDH